VNEQGVHLLDITHSLEPVIERGLILQIYMKNQPVSAQIVNLFKLFYFTYSRFHYFLQIWF
jgi:hypothetical protein